MCVCVCFDPPYLLSPPLTAAAAADDDDDADFSFFLESWRLTEHSF